MDADNSSVNKKKYIQIIGNLAVVISVLYFTTKYFFYDEIQHYYYSVLNGHTLEEGSEFQLNKELFSIVQRGEISTTLKLRGYSLEKLNISLIKPKDKLSDFASSLERNNIVFSDNKCLALLIESDFFGSFKFIIQDLESNYAFLFELKLEDSLVANICSNGIIKSF